MENNIVFYRSFLTIPLCSRVVFDEGVLAAAGAPSGGSTDINGGENRKLTQHQVWAYVKVKIVGRQFSKWGKTKCMQNVLKIIQ